MTTAQDGGQVVSPTHRPPLLPGNTPGDGRNYRPKYDKLIEIINKPLFLHLVGYLYYRQMGFNSVFKGLNSIHDARTHVYERSKLVATVCCEV